MLGRVAAIVVVALGLVAGYGTRSSAEAKPRVTRTARPASHVNKPSSGAQRRQNWRNTRMDLKQRFHKLGTHIRRAKK